MAGEMAGEAAGLDARTRLCVQLVEDEVVYNSVLSAFVKRVVRPVITTPSDYGVQASDSQRVFSNIEELTTLSNLIVTLLKPRPKQWEGGQTARVGDVLSRLQQHSAIFSLFATNLTTSLAIAHRIALTPALHSLVESELGPLLAPLFPPSPASSTPPPPPLLLPLVLCLPIHHMSDVHSRVTAIADITPPGHSDHSACQRISTSLPTLLASLALPLLPPSLASTSLLLSSAFRFPSPPLLRACAILSAPDGTPIVVVITRNKLLVLEAESPPTPTAFLGLSSLTPLLTLQLASCRAEATASTPSSPPALTITDLVTDARHVFHARTVEEARWVESEMVARGDNADGGATKPHDAWRGDVWCVRVWLGEVVREGGEEWLEVRQLSEDEASDPLGDGDEEREDEHSVAVVPAAPRVPEGGKAKAVQQQQQQQHANDRGHVGGDDEAMKVKEGGEGEEGEEGRNGSYALPRTPEKRKGNAASKGEKRVLGPDVSDNIRELFDEYGDMLAEELGPFQLSPSKHAPSPAPPSLPPSPLPFALPNLQPRHPLARSGRHSAHPRNGASKARGKVVEEEEEEERVLLTPSQALSLCEVHVVGSQDTCVEGSSKMVVQYIVRLTLTTRGAPVARKEGGGAGQDVSRSATTLKRFSHFHSLHSTLKGVGLEERLPSPPPKTLKKSAALVRERCGLLNSYIQEVVVLLSAVRREGVSHKRQQAALALLRFLGLDVVLQAVRLEGVRDVVSVPSLTVHLPNFEVEVDVEGVTCGELCMEVLERQHLEEVSWKYSLFAEVEGDAYFHILDHSLRVPDIPASLSTTRVVKWSSVKCHCLKIVMSPSYASAIVEHRAAPNAKVTLGTASSLPDPHTDITPTLSNDLVFEFHQAVFFVSAGLYTVDANTAVTLAALYLRHLLTSPHAKATPQAKGAFVPSSVQLVGVTTQQVSNYLGRLLPRNFPLAANEAIEAIKAEIANNKSLAQQAAPHLPASYLATLTARNVLVYGCVMFAQVTIESVNDSTVIPSLVSKRHANKGDCGDDSWREADTSGLGCGTANQPLFLPHTGTLGVRLDNVLLFGGNTQRLLQRFPMRRIEDSLCNHDEVTLYGSSLKIVLRTADAHRLSCCVENFLEIRRHFVVC